MIDEKRIKQAMDRAQERLRMQPHPLTGRPLTSEQAHRRAAELARAHEQKRKADDLVVADR